ncbi:fungal-specific transcription factor domain-containing protein [Aspergillus transmontanensis]|uniref:Fungal-specific transcription factor domain-containing protein n=1 Tax=Aspergillus transmontanensis TaxID=1034304 RepID=A0A5N6VIH3_9EURO|nr:fungal-specific transcription factor domain-containing protein [Aspergillus transmontanensis]
MEEASLLRIVPYSPTHANRSKRTRKRASLSRNPHSPDSVVKIRNACTTCREKKTRCSGHTPCIRCRQNSQPCQYMPVAWHHHPRGQPGESNAGEISKRQLSTEVDQESSRDAQRTPEEPPQEDQYGHFHGSASGFAFLQLVKARLASLPSMSLNFPDYPLVNSTNSPATLPPKSIADTLIHNYFDFGLTTSRFVHKNSLLASHENLYSNNPDSLPSQDDRALVYMVMAIGSHYAQANTVFSGFSASVQYFTMAQKELERGSSKITLSSLQARLLITHYLLNHSRMHDAWSFFGIVVRHAQALRLHRETTASLTNFIEHEYRKKLFWSIYIYDRILSSIFGRPAALHDDDIDQEECRFTGDDDVTISEEHLKGKGAFCSGAALIYYARLAKILGMVLREFYGPLRKRHDLQSLRGMAVKMQQLLQDWLLSLPAFLDFISLPPSAMSTLTQRQLCTLKLIYSHTRLLLYRPFILYCIQQNGDAQDTPDLAQWFTHCSDKSIEAAYSIVDECRSLQNRGLFSRRFWLVNYTQFAAIGTLYMYSSIRLHEPGIRAVADEALTQFPVGVEGDLVGQRYLDILRELQKVTLQCSATTDNTFDGSTVDGSGLDLPDLDDMLLGNGDPFGSAVLNTAFIDAYLREAD